MPSIPDFYKACNGQVSIYSRVSSQKQAKLSLPARLEALEDWAKSLQFNVRDIRGEVCSGRTVERPILFDSLDYAERNRLGIIFDSADRIFRDELKRSKLLRVCDDCAIPWLIVNLGYSPAPGESWESPESRTLRGQEIRRSLAYKHKHNIGKPPGRPEGTHAARNELIRALKANGEKIEDIASKFQLTERTILRICSDARG